MPDLIGDGEFCTVADCLLTLSSVKLTCLTLFERSRPVGVLGIVGSAFSRFGLLGLLVKEGMAEGFFELKLGCLRIDLTRSNFPGLRRNPFESDFGMLLRLFVVEDLGSVRGVPF
jgi:hypothetical protein